MKRAWDINENFQCGWDFCDAVRAAAGTGSLARAAAEYQSAFGRLEQDYTMQDFRILDRREGRVTTRCDGRPRR